MDNKYLAQHQAQVLRQCQIKQLAILDAIDAICRKHGIDYWLDGGTLLGALRHGGFIPWDDDIDIAMTKDDLERFVAVAPAELPETLHLQTPQSEPTKEPIVKVRDLNSFCVEASDRFDAPYAKGLYVDIFPFVDYPRVGRRFVRHITRGISRSHSILHKAHHYTLRAFAEFWWFGAKLILYRAVWRVACLLRRPSTSDAMGNILINNGYGIMHKRSLTFPLSTVTFEGKDYPSPRDAHAYLTDLYGDYMTVPPPEKRQAHSVLLIPELA